MRYQPQGRIRIDRSHPHLTSGGGVLLGLLVGPHFRVNQVNGKLNTLSGAAQTLMARGSGVGVFNPTGSGDVAMAIEAAGGSKFTDFWYGRIYTGSADTNHYLFGDYNGAQGQGIAVRHGSSGGTWGYFDGSAFYSSGEIYTVVQDGQPHSFAVCRDVVNGFVKVYRDGILKVTTNNGTPTLTGNLAVGSLGMNQHGSFGTESLTEVFGRIRYNSWNERQIREFHNNPYLFLQAPEDDFDEVVSAGGGPTIHTLVGTSTNQGNSSTAGVAGQRHSILAAGTSQANTTSVAPAVHRHALGGSTSSQSSTSSSGAISLRRSLTGSATTQGNTSSSSSIGQRHKVLGSTTTQANTSSIGALGEQRIALGGSTSSQANGSPSMPIAQRHVVIGAGAVQGNTSTTGIVVSTPPAQIVTLVGSNCVQSNLSSIGAIVVSDPRISDYMRYVVDGVDRKYVVDKADRRFVVGPKNTRFVV